MKYFTYALIAAANDWIEQSEIELQEAGKSFDRKVEEYHSELEGLRSRISQKAWDFFRYGANEYGLHDGTLISLTVGDGLDSPVEGTHHHPGSIVAQLRAESNSSTSNKNFIIRLN